MTAEEVIKSELDGWFFRFDNDYGRVVRNKVPKNYIPEFAAPENAIKDASHHNVKLWSENEDDQLIALRDEGKSFDNIGKTMKRAVQLCRDRYAFVCEKRGISPKLSSLQKKFTAEQAEILWTLRTAGMPFAEIGERIGLSKKQATDFYQHLRQQRVWRDAA